VAAQSKARIVFARSNTEILGSNLTGGIYICVRLFCVRRVEAGKNTSTVIPASGKRRRKANPVVSGETVPADLRKRLMRTSLDKPLQVIYTVSKLAYTVRTIISAPPLQNAVSHTTAGRLQLLLCRSPKAVV
jgi:hypothetical protein